MFQVTAKTDYGLLFMVALAKQGGGRPVPLRTIARERRLPYSFLTQIVIPLRQAGLVEAKEGVNGGYQLSRLPAQMSVGDVIRALEGEFHLVRCLRHGVEERCPSEALCTLPPFWTEVSKRVTTALDNMSLAELAVQSKPAEVPARS